MSKLTINKRVKLQANIWITRLNRGLTDEEKLALVAWINQSTVHHYAIYNVATFFDNTSQLKELNGIFPIERLEQRSIDKKALFFVTCIILLLMVVAYSFWSNKQISIQNSPAIYASTIGQSRTIHLDDGSIVTLNSNSKIKVSYDVFARHINLLRGEAQFYVAKDINRPFTVTAGAKSFTALGTIFNVQKNNELDMELIVSEGQVLITKANIASSSLAEMINQETAKSYSDIIINDGEKSVIENAEQLTTTQLLPEQIQQKLAWQKGIIVFNGEPLIHALEEVSRYTHTRFEVSDVQIKNIQVAGSYHINDINSLLSSLEGNFNISYKFSANNSVQLSKKQS